MTESKTNPTHVVPLEPRALKAGEECTAAPIRLGYDGKLVGVKLGEGITLERIECRCILPRTNYKLSEGGEFHGTDWMFVVVRAEKDTTLSGSLEVEEAAQPPRPTEQPNA